MDFASYREGTSQSVTRLILLLAATFVALCAASTEAKAQFLTPDEKAAFAAKFESEADRIEFLETVCEYLDDGDWDEYLALHQSYGLTVSESYLHIDCTIANYPGPTPAHTVFAAGVRMLGIFEYVLEDIRREKERNPDFDPSRFFNICFQHLNTQMSVIDIMRYRRSILRGTGAFSAYRDVESLLLELGAKPCPEDVKSNFSGEPTRF